MMEVYSGWMKGSQFCKHYLNCLKQYTLKNTLKVLLKSTYVQNIKVINLSLLRQKNTWRIFFNVIAISMLKTASSDYIIIKTPP